MSFMPIWWILNMDGIMSSIDFFDSKYIPACEKTRKERKFGICDSSMGAYTSLDGNYDCLVINKHQKDIQFIPIDHNIPFFDKNGKQLSSCDGMLYNADYRYEFIVFIELKSGTNKRNWRSDAINQLLSTVRVFICNHDPNKFNKKKCYASNAVHQIIGKVYQNELNDFAEQTAGFILKINYEVVI